jgi:hypothetical protein
MTNQALCHFDSSFFFSRTVDFVISIRTAFSAVLPFCHFDTHRFFGGAEEKSVLTNPLVFMTVLNEKPSTLSFRLVLLFQQYS